MRKCGRLEGRMTEMTEMRKKAEKTWTEKIERMAQQVQDKQRINGVMEVGRVRTGVNGVMGSGLGSTGGSKTLPDCPKP